MAWEELNHWGCPSVTYRLVVQTDTDTLFLDSIEKPDSFYVRQLTTREEAAERKANWKGCSFGDCACNCK